MRELTQLLDAAAAGDRGAASDLLPLVYDELRRLAAVQLAAEAPGQTLQPTALVHEAYLRLVGSADGPHWRGRGHFYAAAAQAMRREVVDLARYKKRKKPGGARARVFLDVDRLADPQPADDLLDLHDALTAFAAVEPQIADLVTLRYFGGLT